MAEDTSNYLGNKSIVIPIHKPDLKEKLFFLISGMIISVPFSVFTESTAAYFLGSQFSLFFTQLIIVAIAAPILEEFAKTYPLLYRHGETQRSIMSLGFYTGLGFGIIEFLSYVLIFNAPIIPRIFAVIFHASSTSISAFGIAKKKFLAFYAMAVTLHFLNNFFAIIDISPTWDYVSSTTILLIAFFLPIFLRSKASKFTASLS